MKKTLYFEFQGHPFPTRIFFAPNKKAWAQVMEELNVKKKSAPYPKHSGSVTSFTARGYPKSLVIAINDSELHEGVTVIGLLVHELVHIKQLTEARMGTKFDHETEAYFMQSMTMWLLGAWAESGRKFKE